MLNFKPKDIIALVVLIGVFVLKFFGKDNYLDTIAALILGYYFAHRVNGDDNGK